MNDYINSDSEELGYWILGMMYLFFPPSGRLREARLNGMKETDRHGLKSRPSPQVWRRGGGLNAILPCSTNLKAAKIGWISSGNSEMQPEDEFTNVISLVWLQIHTMLPGPTGGIAKLLSENIWNQGYSSQQEFGTTNRINAIQLLKMLG